LTGVAFVEDRSVTIPAIGFKEILVNSVGEAHVLRYITSYIPTQ
jgi:hypothetical protein